jgi:type I restriction enzyme S subunit
MKKDWLHIKFADAFVLNMGKTPARAEASYWTDGIYPWVSISDLSGDKFVTHTKEQISQKAVDETNIHLVPKGTVIMSFKLSIGKTAIAPFDLYTNEAIMAFEPKPEISVVPDFLYYYLQYYKWSGNRAVMGETINKAVISNSYADIPPLSIQRSIVAELDLLHSVISKKKEQLRELDNLAQSLFYQMFGDPITNPMGWEIKKLGEVAPVKSYQGEILSEKGLYWLLNLDMVEAQTGKILEKNMVDKDEIGNSTTSFSPDNVLYSKLRPYLNKVVLPDTCGYCTTELLPLLPQRDILNREYLCYLLRSKSFVDYINIKVAGAKMPRVTMDDFRGFSLPLPPLSIQQSFAAKVSAIEAQKQAITQSIKEVEALLAQRMDTYFS